MFALNLDVEVVEKIKELIPNLSKHVEDLLVEYLEANKERQHQDPIDRKIKARIADINLKIARMEQEQADINTTLPLIHSEAEFLIKQLQDNRKKKKTP